MATILLIRHAENEFVAQGRLAGRLSGVSLNTKGESQARLLADKLASAPIKALYSSPLDRCMETAQPLANQLGCEIISNEGLTEVDFGDWAGKTLKQLRRRKLWPVVQQRPSIVQFPNGETFASAQSRITTALNTLSQRHKETDLIACFSHSDIIKLAVAYFLGTPLDLFQRIIVHPASISTLHISTWGIRVINLNYNDLGNFLAPKS
ncbi:MAG: MSMEG_4193 family putative phosphomutase [Chloroflexota bacterium]